MPSEKLRLEAEMRDNASPAVKKLRAELATLQDSTREVRAIGQINKQIEQLKKEAGDVRVTPGMKAMPQWFGSASTAAEGFVKAGGGAAGIINSLGIGGLTAAASMAGLVEHFKSFGANTLAMKEFARETGVSVDYLNALEHAGKSFGLESGTIKQAIAGLADQMPQLKAGFGPLHNLLTSQGWGSLAQKLKTEDTEHALDDILNQLDKIKDPQLQKQLLGDILKAPDLEAVYQRGGFKGLVEEMRKQSAKLPHIGDDAFKQAQAFRDSVIQFDDAMDRFTNTAAPGFLTAMTKLVELATKVAEVVSHPKDLVPHAATADERKKMIEGQKEFDNSNWNPLNWFRIRHKTSIDGSSANSLLHKASFSGGLGSFGDAGPIAEGTKVGFLAAFRELMGGQDLGAGGGEGTGGLIRASLGGGGFGGGGGGHRGGGGGGGDPLDDGPRLRGQGGVKGGVGDRSMRAMSRLIGLGWTEEAAASAVGQAIQESGVRSDGASGDHGTAHGMFQWRMERFAALQRFAAGRKKSWQDFDTQVDFFDAESKTHAGGRERNWRSTHDVGQGNRFGKAFEGYGDNSFGTRLANAQSALRHWRNGGRQAIPDATAGPAAPSSPHVVHLQIDHAAGSRVQVHKQSPGVSTTFRKRWPDGGGTESI